MSEEFQETDLPEIRTRNPNEQRVLVVLPVLSGGSPFGWEIKQDMFSPTALVDLIECSSSISILAAIFVCRDDVWTEESRMEAVVLEGGTIGEKVHSARTIWEMLMGWRTPHDVVVVPHFSGTFGWALTLSEIRSVPLLDPVEVVSAHTVLSLNTRRLLDLRSITEILQIRDGVEPSPTYQTMSQLCLQFLSKLPIRR